MIVGRGPIALAVGAGGGCLDIFTLLYPFSPLSPSLWETARYRLKYCLKGPLNPNNNLEELHRKYVLIQVDKAQKQRWCCLTVILHSNFKTGT